MANSPPVALMVSTTQDTSRAALGVTKHWGWRPETCGLKYDVSAAAYASLPGNRTLSEPRAACKAAHVLSIAKKKTVSSKAKRERDRSKREKKASSKRCERAQRTRGLMQEEPYTHTTETQLVNHLAGPGNCAACTQCDPTLCR